MRATGGFVFNVIASLAVIDSSVNEIDKVICGLIEINFYLACILNFDERSTAYAARFFSLSDDLELWGCFKTFSEEVFNLRLVKLGQG